MIIWVQELMYLVYCARTTYHLFIQTCSVLYLAQILWPFLQLFALNSKLKLLYL
jgi:hypothetical protein